jgi:carbon storage regulator
MLVLTRRAGESIVIGNDITITVVDIRGDQIRIGIDAPRSVQIHREEVYRQLAAENVQAAGSADKARRALGRLPGRPPPVQAPSKSEPEAPTRPPTQAPPQD